MRKTLLLTAVIILAVGLMFAWAGKENAVNKVDLKQDIVSTTSNIAPVTDLILEKAAAEEAKLAAEEAKLDAEKAMSAAEEAKLAAQEAEKELAVPTLSAEGSAQAKSQGKSAAQPAAIAVERPQAAPADKAAKMAFYREKEARLADEIRLTEIKADGIVTPDERVEVDAIYERIFGGIDYPITLSQTSETEPNNDCPSANTIVCGDTVVCAHLEHDVDDDDYFVFTLDDTEVSWTVTITTYATDTFEDPPCTPDANDTYIYLLDDQCIEITHDDDGGDGMFSQIVQSGLLPGTYYVRSESHWSSCTGYYHMDLLCAGPPTGACCEEATGNCVDDVVEADCAYDWTEGTLCAALQPPCGGVCPEDSITIVILTDQYPSETSFELRDNYTGGVVMTGVTPSSYTTYYFTFCAGYDECYDFTLYDSYGDGISPPGGVDIYLNDVMVATNHAFVGDSWTHNYIGNGPDCPPLPPPNDDCVNAELVTGTYPQTVTGTLAGATVDCPGVLDWIGVWYDINLPYEWNDVSISYCGTENSCSPTGIVYFNDCSDCGAYIVADEADYVDCGDGYDNLEMTFYGVQGGRNSIKFIVYLGDYTGDFSFDVDVTEASATIGACCYGEPTAPDCIDNTELECDALSGDWYRLVACADMECPVDYCVGSVWHNGIPDGVNTISTQCADDYPFSSGVADDFILEGEEPIHLNKVIAWIGFWNPAGVNDPSMFDGVNVTIYTNHTDPLIDEPDGEPQDDCSHIGSYFTQYIPQGVFHYYDETDISGDRWVLEIPIDMTVDPNTLYWLEVQPVWDFYTGGQVGWLSTGEQHGLNAMQIFAALGMPDWTDLGTDVAFCLHAGPTITGACCDDVVPECFDGVSVLDCLPPMRAAWNTLCADMDPPCGAGACCDPAGVCYVMTEEDCDAGGWLFMGAGTSCDPNPCPAPGDNCDNPLYISLPADMPYTDAGQTTCGRVDHYDATCLGGYDGGEDIIYEVTVTERGAFNINLDPLGTTWTGIAIGEDCPPTLCVDYSTNSGSAPHGMDNVVLEVGTYYIMVDTWPSPDCIPEFNLTITEGVEPTGACCYGDFTAPDCIEPVTAYECVNTYGGYDWVEDGTCPESCPPLVQGDHCAWPFVVDALPYYDTGNTCDYNDYCSFYAISPDVIYELDLTENAEAVGLMVSLCGSEFDTKLSIYLDDCCVGTYVYNNDDWCGAQSRISESFEPGLYYIIVEGYSSNCGNYMLSIEEYGWCSIMCPGEGIDEAELCGEDLNGGCNADPFVWEQIDCNTTICGTSYGTGTSRDTDWFEFTITEQQVVEVSGIAEFPLQLLFFTVIDPNCVTYEYDVYLAPACSQVDMVYVLDPGTYWIWVGPDDWYTFPCDETGEYGIDYWFSLACSDIGNPDITFDPTSVEGEAYAGGSDSEVLTVTNTGEAESFLFFTADVTQDPLVLLSGVPDNDRSNSDVKMSKDEDRNAPKGTPNIYKRPEPGATTAQLFYEDFDDGSYTDGSPYTWTSHYNGSVGELLIVPDPWYAWDDIIHNNSGHMVGVDDDALGSGVVSICSLSVEFTTPGDGKDMFLIYWVYFDAISGSFFTVEIDDIQVELLTADVLGEDRSVDITSYNDGGTHTLMFIYNDNDAWAWGVAFDDVEIITQDPTWLSIDVTEGMIQEGQPGIDITVTMDADQLGAGTYTGSVDFTTNDPENPTPSVPVTFVVNAAVGSIAGTVSEARAPIDGVNVDLFDAGVPTPIDNTTTAGGGLYSFTDVAVGLYDLEFTHDDYEDVTETDVEVFLGVETTLNVEMETAGWAYVPGDMDMALGQWPPLVNINDVIYLVGYFLIEGQQPCFLGPSGEEPELFASADVDNSCTVNINDVIWLVNYFLLGPEPDPCDAYEPLWPTVSDPPIEMPLGWPPCNELPGLNNLKVIPTDSNK